MAKKVVPGSITKPYTPQPGDFSPNLVGFQFTKGNSLLTFGNFEITTNLEPLTGEIFNTGQFSDSFNLENLNLTEQDSNTIYNNSVNTLSVKLKNDKTNFLNYVYFSDSVNFVEKEVSGIVLNWKGSLFLQKSNINDTVIDFSYNTNNNITTFKIPVLVAQNVFGLFTFETTDTVTDENNISVLKQSFLKYEISNNYGKFNVVGYTGNTPTNDYITLKTEGLTWPNLYTGSTTSGSFTYHLKPTEETLDKVFFSRLSDFQTHLLNRLTTPKYTLILNIPRINNQGFTLNDEFKLTWPTPDGYNIDIGARNPIFNPTSNQIRYSDYLNSLFNLAKNFDSETTNIAARRLVSSSIFEFDTAGDGTENSGRKLNKLIKIWGREYDAIKKYIDAISFANTVTYSGKDNTPDELIKMMAKTLGFDTIQSFSNNDLINYLVKTTNSVFSGQSRSLTTQELDTELWRRLIINAWWLFKSKGTRKVIEFFLKLFQIDECLIDFNEYVYLAEQRLSRIDTLIQLDTILGPGAYFEDDLPFDFDGYPRILPDTPEYYFQLDGFWYDGGVKTGDIPDVNGNNPHFGPYDYGAKYFNKFRCFIDDFEPISETINLNTLTFNYFTDYTLGSVEGGQQNVISINENGSSNDLIPTNNLALYSDFYADIMNTTGRVSPNLTIINAGRTDQNSNNGTSSFQINFFAGDKVECGLDCPEVTRLWRNGNIQYESPVGSNNWEEIRNEECCSELGGYSLFDDTFTFVPSPGLAEEEGGPTKCYWCPPQEYLIETEINGTNSSGLPTEFTLLSFDTGQQLVSITTRECCERSGGKWKAIQLPNESLPVLRCVLDSIVIDDSGDDTIDDTGDGLIDSTECTFDETNLNSEFSTITNYPEDIFLPGTLGSSAAKQYPIFIQNAPCPDTSGGSIPASQASQFKLVVTVAPVTVKMVAFGGNPDFGNPNDYCIYEPTGDPLFYTLINAGEQAGTSFTTIIYGEGGTTDSIGQIGGLTPLGSTENPTNADRYCFRITEPGTYYIYTQVLPWFKDDNNHSVMVTVE